MGCRRAGVLYIQPTMPAPPSTDAARQAAEIARDCMASRVRRLERRLTRIYDDALRALGLTGSQLALLVATQLSGKTTPEQYNAA